MSMIKTITQHEFKKISEPDLVQVRVQELHDLRKIAALFVAINKLDVLSHVDYKAAKIIAENNSICKNISLGWTIAILKAS